MAHIDWFYGAAKWDDNSQHLITGLNAKNMVTSCRMIECKAIRFQHLTQIIKRDIVWILAKFLESFVPFCHLLFYLNYCKLKRSYPFVNCIHKHRPSTRS